MKAGVVLGLYSQQRGYDYGPKLREIRALGATWVELLVVQVQDDVNAACIRPDPLKTPPDEEVAAAVRQAHALGLRVLLMPIVLLERAGPKDWRGSIQPRPLDEWLDAYRSMLLYYALLCQREGVEALAVGSELCSLEWHESYWRGLIAETRAVYGGQLTYSFNWDHYQVARWQDALDFVGLSAYFSLTQSREPALAELVEAWRPIQAQLAAWQARHGRPLVFLEIGYPSVDGGNMDPWNYVMPGPLDHAEQALCYEALRRAWGGSELAAGLFFYDWWEAGGPEDRTYTPRGKPAEAVLRRFLGELGASEK
jgi:hypothetical protein